MPESLLAVVDHGRCLPEGFGRHEALASTLLVVMMRLPAVADYDDAFKGLLAMSERRLCSH